MEIKGKIKQSLPLEQGQGAKGPWKKRGIVIETMGPFPKPCVVEFWNDKLGLLTGLKAGLGVTIEFELSSRESNGRWYTSAKALSLTVYEETAPKNPASQSRRVEREEQPVYDDDTSDLPF